MTTSLILFGLFALIMAILTESVLNALRAKIGHVRKDPRRLGDSFSDKAFTLGVPEETI